MIGHLILAAAIQQTFPLGVLYNARGQVNSRDWVQAQVVENAAKCGVIVEIRERAPTERGVTISDAGVLLVSVPSNATQAQRDCLASAVRTIPAGPGSRPAEFK